MEKYLTPIQYEQYVHDKAYQAAMANTSPSVEQVVVLTALIIVVVLTLFLIAEMWDRYEDEDELPGEVRDAQAAAKERVAMKREFDQVAAENDKAWAKEFGHTR